MGDRCARCAASQRSNIVKQSFVLSGGRNRGRPLRALRRVAAFQHFKTTVCSSTFFEVICKAPWGMGGVD